MEKQVTFKSIMGNYPTGVCVITSTTNEGVPVGLTVNSFASVSLDPTLILWSIDKRVHSYEVFKNTKNFVVHILSSEQASICSLFATKDVDRFSNCKWKMSANNQPIIMDCAAVLECQTFKTVDAGDHLIIIGEVTDLQNNEKDPLMYHRRNFGPIPEQFYQE